MDFSRVGWMRHSFPGAGAMSSITLGRTHMTVKVREDKVLYKPKERVRGGFDRRKYLPNAPKLVFDDFCSWLFPRKAEDQIAIMICSDLKG